MSEGFRGDIPVAQHFNTAGYSLDDILVEVVKVDLPQRDIRQREDGLYRSRSYRRAHTHLGTRK